MIKLSNKHKVIDNGVNNVINLNQSNIYESERENGSNLRLMFNVGVVSDCSLFNPVTEFIKEGKIHIGGITKISDEGGKVSDIESDDIMPGIDLMNALSIRCYDQPYISNQFSGFELENTNRAYKRSLISSANTSSDAPWYRKFVHNTTQWYDNPSDEKRMNNETVFAFGKYMSFGTAVNKRLYERGGEYGFINPISLADTLSNRNKTDGLISDISGKFVSMYPSKDYYTFHDVYNKYNNRIEPNWHARITYPNRNYYPESFFRTLHENEVSLQGVRHGLIIWALDESMSKQRTFRTICKNGFKIGDIVAIYKNGIDGVPQRQYSAVEIIDKPDDYSFTVSVEGNPMYNWAYSAEISFDVNDHTTEYFKTDNGILCKYTFINEDNEEVVVSGSAAYSNELSVVRVENFVECDYYIKMLKDTGAKLISKRNSFSHNIYGINNGYLITQNDIDMNMYTDNLGRPLNDIFLTVVKDNKGYEEWYNSNQDERQTNPELTHSHCFGPIRGGYELDPFLNLPTDIKNITGDNGHAVKLDDGSGDFFIGEYMGDICEYSPSVFLEHTIQSFEHRFNTAQRDCINGNIELRINDIDFTIGTKDLNKQRYKPYAAGIDEHIIHLRDIKDDMSVGYVYKPHYRISVRTIKRELSSVEAESYRVVKASSGMLQNITYGNIESEEAVYDITLNIPNKMPMMTPIMLYFKSKMGPMYDMSFNAKFIVWHKETLIGVALDDKSEMNLCDEYVQKSFGEGKEYDLFVVIINNGVPNYASFISDNGFYYRWRDIVTNGTNGDDWGRIYPFANGAFYIENNLSIYLKKQREIIYDELDEDNNPIWPIDYSRVLYTPRTIKVEEVNKKYDDGSSIKEIEDCGDIKI